MNEINKHSYTAASSFPAKLFADDSVLQMVREHRIRPLHVQINMQNKCPLKCGFCSCANRDFDYEMPYDQLISISETLIKLGAVAFTNTGGGECLAYEKFGEYVDYLRNKKMEISLTTNGVLFNKHNLSFIDKLAWCRVSLSDERDLCPTELEEALKHKTEWSFSYVVTEGRLDRIIRAIEFANKHNFTHVRIVDDILGNTVSLDHIKDTLAKHNINTSRIIWQGRKEYTKGSKMCLVSLLKPNIDVYGNLTGCCGVQVASNPPALDFTRVFRVCDSKGIEDAYKNQKYFNGSVCERCYYSDYNAVLGAMWNANDLKHKEFL